jgi:FHA domain
VSRDVVHVATTEESGVQRRPSADDLVRLRIWGSDEVFSLPPPSVGGMIGAARSCAIRLRDPTGRVSGHHARLLCAGGQWCVHELDVASGILLDGARHVEFPLTPGAEIGIGGVTLVAESNRQIALRAFLARLLGWSRERGQSVELALRAVRMAAARRIALVLCGSDDLVAIASTLHRIAFGEERPFIRCLPPHRRGRPAGRPTRRHKLGLPALAAAAGGSLCICSKRLPSDFAELAAALCSPAAGAQLIVCGGMPSDAGGLVASAQVVIPPLAARHPELGRIIDEYGADAAARLSSRGTTATAEFTATDREWVRAHAAASLGEIERGTQRIVALRLGGSIARAAARLNMSHVALAEWFRRRRGLRPSSRSTS